MHKYFLGALVMFFIMFLSFIAFAEPNDGFPQEPVEQGPYWAEKPIQCGPLNEVIERITADGLLPLMAMIGNARVGDNMRVMEYGMWYNPESQAWIIAEFFNEETMCIIGVGQGVDFDVADYLNSKT